MNEMESWRVPERSRQYFYTIRSVVKVAEGNQRRQPGRWNSPKETNKEGKQAHQDDQETEKIKTEEGKAIFLG